MSKEPIKPAQSSDGLYFRSGEGSRSGSRMDEIEKRLTRMGEQFNSVKVTNDKLCHEMDALREEMNQVKISMNLKEEVIGETLDGTETIQCPFTWRVMLSNSIYLRKLTFFSTDNRIRYLGVRYNIETDVLECAIIKNKDNNKGVWPWPKEFCLKVRNAESGVNVLVNEQRGWWRWGEHGGVRVCPVVSTRDKVVDITIYERKKSLSASTSTIVVVLVMVLFCMAVAYGIIYDVVTGSWPATGINVKDVVVDGQSKINYDDL